MSGCGGGDHSVGASLGDVFRLGPADTPSHAGREVPRAGAPSFSGSDGGILPSY